MTAGIDELGTGKDAVKMRWPFATFESAYFCCCLEMYSNVVELFVTVCGCQGAGWFDVCVERAFRDRTIRKNGAPHPRRQCRDPGHMCLARSGRVVQATEIIALGTLS
jgi:hypothetical protein